MQGYILTYCQNEEALYGNLLTARTLRVGFPSTPIVVFDNHSRDEFRPLLREAYEAAGCGYRDIHYEIKHHSFIQDMLGNQQYGSAVFIDPDICFWGNMEGVAFDGLMKGWRIPSFYDPYTQCNTVTRLHTSLLYFPDVQRLLERLEEERKVRFEAHDFSPTMLKVSDTWIRWDTCAAVCAMLGADAVEFTDAERSLYDHLFCGTHFGLVKSSFEDTGFEDLHERVAAGDLNAMRNIRAVQEAYFNSHAWR